MAARNLSVDEQLEVIMRGTRFADEAEDWSAPDSDGTGKEASKRIDMRGTRFADEAEEWSPPDSDGKSMRAQMRQEMREKLERGRPLRVYLGVDPTAADLHVGLFVPLQKLRRFQVLGLKVIFLIGDYTATIGDPSDQTSERRRITHKDVLKMAQTFAEQAFKVLDPRSTEIRRNGDWLASLSFADIIELAGIFPLKQIVARRDFQQRMERGESLRFHEALYALMQGYDAHALDCDVQIGAYDQHFNMLAGRAIQQHFGKTPHVMITNPLLVGTDGRKMSKSYGNTININDNPFDMYGKSMRIDDGQIADYLELATLLQGGEIDELLQKLDGGINPMEVKKSLAFNLVRQYHGDDAAAAAEAKFFQVVQQKAAPDDVEEKEVPPELAAGTWVDICKGLGLIKVPGGDAPPHAAGRLLRGAGARGGDRCQGRRP